MYCW
jgi:hypothetical protein